jgi:hypothetical protein
MNFVGTFFSSSGEMHIVHLLAVFDGVGLATKASSILLSHVDAIYGYTAQTAWRKLSSPRFFGNMSGRNMGLTVARFIYILNAMPAILAHLPLAK